MNYLFAGLAVYKLVQLFNSLTPREAMPWVKVLLGILLGYALSFPFGLPDRWTSGLVVATIASASHTVLRCFTLFGDMAFKKSK